MFFGFTDFGTDLDCSHRAEERSNLKKSRSVHLAEDGTSTAIAQLAAKRRVVVGGTIRATVPYDASTFWVTGRLVVQLSTPRKTIAGRGVRRAKTGLTRNAWSLFGIPHTKAYDPPDSGKGTSEPHTKNVISMRRP